VKCRRDREIVTGLRELDLLRVPESRTAGPDHVVVSVTGAQCCDRTGPSISIVLAEVNRDGVMPPTGHATLFPKTASSKRVGW
jgi:hypothetical protein